MKNKVYLMTPNWERGLPSLASVSWNISVPSDQVAYLTFLKERTSLVCQTGRAFMIIQEQRTKAEQIFSLEEALPKPSSHHHNFWVNISNCSPVSGKQLDLLFQVSLTWRTLGKGLQGFVGMVMESKLVAEGEGASLGGESENIALSPGYLYICQLLLQSCCITKHPRTQWLKNNHYYCSNGGWAVLI